MLEGRRQMMQARNITTVNATVVASGDKQVLIELSWVDPDRANETERLWQLITLRDGRIVDIQDYGKQSRGLKAMR